MIALVTGASSGLGAAAARRLAREPGAHLVLVARRRERLDELAGELGGATVIAADLLEEATPALVAQRVTDEHGRLDLLVNNAGVGGRGSFAEGGWAEVHRVMAINFDAQVRLTEALLPLLRRSAPSGVVNIGSVAGRVSRPRVGSYSASKFALAGWTEALRHGGGAPRRPRRPGPARVRGHRGLPAAAAAGPALDPLDGLDRGQGGRDDPRRLAQPPARGVRAQAVRAGPGGPGAAARPVPAGRGRRRLHGHAQAARRPFQRSSSCPPAKAARRSASASAARRAQAGRRPGERLDGDLRGAGP